MDHDETHRTDDSVSRGSGKTVVERSTTLAPGATSRRRRSFIRAVGGVALVGLLAGCSGGGDGNPGGGDGSDATSVDEWLADTGNYDGVVDVTGEDAVTVEVGAPGNSGANAFAPAAIEISPGTTVTWEWVNGYHNVVANDGEFDSGGPEQNATFQHTFVSSGTVLYLCEPHESIGMKGAIVVSGGDGGEPRSPADGTERS